MCSLCRASPLARGEWEVSAQSRYEFIRWLRRLMLPWARLSAQQERVESARARAQRQADRRARHASQHSSQLTRSRADRSPSRLRLDSDSLGAQAKQDCRWRRRRRNDRGLRSFDRRRGGRRRAVIKKPPNKSRVLCMQPAESSRDKTLKRTPETPHREERRKRRGKAAACACCISQELSAESRDVSNQRDRNSNRNRTHTQARARA